MRHARKAAASAGMTVMIAAALIASPPARSQEFDHTGGTAGPTAVISTRGTGGAVYVAVAPKPRPVRRTLTRGPLAHRPLMRRPATRGPSRHRPAAPRPAPNAAPGPAVEVAPGAPTPAQTVAEGAVFPVSGPHSFGGPENRFGAQRAGHVHEGQDILAAEGVPDVAPMAGTIITTGNQAGAAGWYVAEHTSGAFDFFFAHCEAGSIAVHAGQSVAAGQQLCLLGQTGDATGPHLHFEMWLGGWRAPGGHAIDPLPYLEAWERGPGS
jgi:murein DD-endopeptidase MepM/ murein hydrolase activator NlpD